MTGSKPDPGLSVEGAYLSAVAARLESLLGAKLIGVYAGGSYALGGFRRGHSDLDVAAVADSAISHGLKERIGAGLRHEAIPCPARGLELVVYRLQTTRSPAADRDFELNLNSGPGMDPRTDYHSGSVASHWFPVDRSILAQAGIPILGPPAAEVFAAIDPVTLTPILIESIAWHKRNRGGAADAVLNSCRALRYAREGIWSSKPEAGLWAIDAGAMPADIVSAALAMPGNGRQLNPDAVDEVLDRSVEMLMRPEARPPGIRR
jgi:hypothetical protein